MSEKFFFTVSETAEILRIHPKTVQHYLRLGKLPGIKLGKAWRVPKSALLSMAKPTEPEYLSTAEIIELAEERAKELAFLSRREAVVQYQQLLEAIEAEAKNKDTATEDYPQFFCSPNF
jgi:excisionase family DNA binding protein